MTPFTNERYWQQFRDWVASQGPAEAREIMSAYIEENFQHFMQFAENRRLISPKK